MNGWKTYLAALIAALVAGENALDAAGIGLVPEAVEEIILTAAAALGLYGLRHALGRWMDTKELP